MPRGAPGDDAPPARDGALTGLKVVGLELVDGSVTLDPSPETELAPGWTLLAIGSREQVMQLRKMGR